MELGSIEEVQEVHIALEKAKLHGLESEVLLWAIKYAQNNPKASIEECMEAGLMEWDI